MFRWDCLPRSEQVVVLQRISACHEPDYDLSAALPVSSGYSTRFRR